MDRSSTCRRTTPSRSGDFECRLGRLNTTYCRTTQWWPSPFRRHRRGGVAAFACVPEEGRTGGEALKTLLAQHFPWYAVPRHVFVLRELPRTSSGKVDRKVSRGSRRVHHHERRRRRGGGAGGARGGSGGVSGSRTSGGTSDAVKECIADATGVTPVDSDRLGSLGLDSMSVVMLSAQLRRRVAVHARRRAAPEPHRRGARRHHRE